MRLRLSSGVPKPGSEGRPPCCRRYLSDGRTGHQSGGHSQHLVCFQRGCQNRPVPGGARLAVCGADRTYLFQSRKERLEPVRLRLVFLRACLVLICRLCRSLFASVTVLRSRCLRNRLRRKHIAASILSVFCTLRHILRQIRIITRLNIFFGLIYLRLFRCLSF